MFGIVITAADERPQHLESALWHPRSHKSIGAWTMDVAVAHRAASEIVQAKRSYPLLLGVARGEIAIGSTPSRSSLRP